MLRLADRVYVAMGAGMGIQLAPAEVCELAEMLIHVQMLTETRHTATQASAAERGVIRAAKRLLTEK